jgi:hypothetical protein
MKECDYPKRALKYFDEALKIEPSSQLWFLKADTLLLLEKYEDAI